MRKEGDGDIWGYVCMENHNNSMLENGGIGRVRLEQGFVEKHSARRSESGEVRDRRSVLNSMTAFIVKTHV